PLDGALKRFRELLLFSPGEVYSHAYWGDGVIQSADFGAGEIVADFPGEKGKALRFDFFQKHLRRQPANSFRTLRATAPDKLRDLAEDDAVELVKLILRGEGGKLKQSELKSLITNGVLDEESWNSW